jgi:putative tryptophan/tyrosine transport system substrate-binding protein
MLMTDLAVEELELLKEAIPHALRVGVLWNPSTPSHAPALQAVESAGGQLGVQLLIIPARTIEDFDGALAQMAQERVDGFLVVAAPSTYLGRALRTTAMTGLLYVLFVAALDISRRAR